MKKLLLILALFAPCVQAQVTPVIPANTVVGNPTGSAAAPSTYATSGSGSVCLTTSCSMTTPALGTPSAIVATNATGTAASLTAGTATVANGLKSATTTVVVSAATAPSSGKVLTATSSTAADWETPSSSATSITPGTTTIVGATAPCLINNTTSTTMGCATTSSATLADLQASTTFTVSGTGCTPSAHAGGPFSGTITLASGPCTAVTVTINGSTGFTAPTGFQCWMQDGTLIHAGTFIPNWSNDPISSTTTTAVFPIPTAAQTSGDVMVFSCSYG